MGKNNTLKFEIITSVSQMTVNLPNYVKEFKIQFYDESENFRSLKDPLGMERVFFVADLKKSKTFKFGFPIIAKVNLRHLKNRGIMKRKYYTLFEQYSMYAHSDVPNQTGRVTDIWQNEVPKLV